MLVRVVGIHRLQELRYSVEGYDSTAEILEPFMDDCDDEWEAEDLILNHGKKLLIDSDGLLHFEIKTYNWWRRFIRELEEMDYQAMLAREYEIDATLIDNIVTKTEYDIEVVKDLARQLEVEIWRNRVRGRRGCGNK